MALAACLAALAVPATGQSTARLEGAWSVTLRDVEVKNLIDNRLLTVHRRWRFRPQCARGACDVDLIRPVRALGGTVVSPLSREGSRYAGTKISPGDAVCRGRVVKRGYTYTESIVVRVTRVVDDRERADRIRGRYTARGRPRKPRCEGGPTTLERAVLRGSLLRPAP
jgi:hypothetical protein